MSISSFDRGIVSSGSWRSKTWLIVYFKSFICGPDKFNLSVEFSFSINRKRSFLCEFCFILFCRVLFFIHCEFGIGLKVDIPSESTS